MRFPDPIHRTSDDRGVGFRAILQELALPRQSQAIDLGAGGFAGEATTQHLLDYLDGPIDAVELAPQNVLALQKRFGERVRVFEADAVTFDFPHAYDFVSSDLDTRLLPWMCSDLLQRLKLSTGGWYVSHFIYDCEAILGGENPIIPSAARTEIQGFIERSFGAPRVTADMLRPFFSERGFTVQGIVAKWPRNRDFDGLGWLVLRKMRFASLTRYFRRSVRQRRPPQIGAAANGVWQARAALP